MWFDDAKEWTMLKDYEEVGLTRIIYIVINLMYTAHALYFFSSINPKLLSHSFLFIPYRSASCHDAIPYE